MTRILIHDYSGHPFQAQLSRELARRGNDVLHLTFAGFQTPKGNLTRHADDPAGLAFGAVTLDEPFDKHSLVHRLRQEREIGRRTAAWVARFHPEVVISGNAPLDVQSIVASESRRQHAAFLFWIQDLYSVAIARALRQRFRLPGTLAAQRFIRLEASTLRSADGIVAITEDFIPALRNWGVALDRITVIENWAPLDEIYPVARDNEWARRHGLADRQVILYSGTLGMKHDPSLLVALAERLPDAVVLVVSEGPGADWLKSNSRGTNIRVLPFQPFEVLPAVLGTADLLVSILEPDAGVFSVPSKVLSSLAAGRAILAAIPVENLAARTIARARAGQVVDPRDRAAFAEAAAAILGDNDARLAAGVAARRYAEQAFDISAIADRFADAGMRAIRARVRQ